MDGQFSDAFKAQYRRSYGRVYSPVAPDYTRCAGSVLDGLHPGQCSRKNGHGPHGAWCKQHDPVAVESKRKAQDDKWRAESELKLARHAAIAALEPALRQIAAGHNDPRGLAESVIAALDAARNRPQGPEEE